MGVRYSVSGLGISTSRRCSWEEGRVSYTFLIGPNKKQKPLLGFGSGLWAELSGRGALAMPEGIEPYGALCLLRETRSSAQGNAASACAHASPPSSCACALRLCISLPARVPAPVRVRIPACLLLSLFLCLLAGSELCVASALWVCLGVRWPRSLPERCLCLVPACPAAPRVRSAVCPRLQHPPQLFWGVSVVVLPCELAGYSMFLRTVSLTNKSSQVLGEKLPFPSHHKSFLQNNRTLT